MAFIVYLDSVEVVTGPTDGQWSVFSCKRLITREKPVGSYLTQTEENIADMGILRFYPYSRTSRLLKKWLVAH